MIEKDFVVLGKALKERFIDSRIQLAAYRDTGRFLVSWDDIDDSKYYLCEFGIKEIEVTEVSLVGNAEDLDEWV